MQQTFELKRRENSGFTVIEVLVVIGIIGLLLAILLPAAEKVRHRAYLAACANNLKQIGAGMAMYANDNHGAYPRTRYVPGGPLAYGTGAGVADPFGAGGPAANDVTAAAFLLLRAEKMPAAVFVCPYPDIFVYVPDPARDLSARADFTSFKTNMGYSIANPYPSTAAVKADYKYLNTFSAEFALAADMNPGMDATEDDVTAITPTSTGSAIKKATSNNHEKDGQNVLYADGHVGWQTTPLCGVDRDNIYTSKSGSIEASPMDKGDSVLLPTEDD